MTDNEIIKALECCKSSVASCEECPMYVEGVICHGYELNRKALDLIIRQQSEIERLQKDKSEWIHLPCKVGTQVFFLRDKNNIIETNVEKIIFKGKDGKGCYIKLECNAMYETSCQSIGKTVFFTRESAEKALEKRRKNT